MEKITKVNRERILMVLNSRILLHSILIAFWVFANRPPGLISLSTVTAAAASVTMNCSTAQLRSPTVTGALPTPLSTVPDKGHTWGKAQFQGLLHLQATFGGCTADGHSAQAGQGPIAGPVV